MTGRTATNWLEWYITQDTMTSLKMDQEQCLTAICHGFVDWQEEEKNCCLRGPVDFYSSELISVTAVALSLYPKRGSLCRTNRRKQDGSQLPKTTPWCQQERSNEAHSLLNTLRIHKALTYKCILLIQNPFPDIPCILVEKIHILPMTIILANQRQAI